MASIRLAAAAAVILLGTAAAGCDAAGVRLPPGGGHAPAAPSEPDGARPAPGPARTPGGEEGPRTGPGTDPEERPSASDPATGEAQEPEEAPEEAVAAYMEALASGDPARMAAGLAYAAEDSTAHDYLAHQVSVARAGADGGSPAAAFEVERTAHGWKLCRGSDPGGAPGCSGYRGFTAQDGLVGGLRVNGGDPGPGLLVPAPGTRPRAESAGVSATLLTAYRSTTAKALVVTVGFETRENADLDLGQAVYRSGSGHESRVDAVAGRRELDAGTLARAAFHLPGASSGGVLRVGGCLEECSSLVELAVPVR
ncbi:hypothetical protein ABZ234_26770 [Nocardiopsis sp. NPDC006198]|uniref:hypothetical protein n=1 Tax=Nocardiopsis sp. NPDC006198 TaxID=3154472 RepID=UPI0033B838B3